MKSKYTIRIMLIAAVLFYAGCGSDDETEVSVIEQQTEKLKGSWKATTVTLDEVTQDSYDAFTLTITPNTSSSVHYAIAGNPDYSPWVSEFGDAFRLMSAILLHTSFVKIR